MAPKGFKSPRWGKAALTASRPGRDISRSKLACLHTLIVFPWARAHYGGSLMTKHGLATLVALLFFSTSLAADDSASVADLQRFLNNRNCDAGAIDGNWGRKSQAALDQFSAHFGERIDFPVLRSVLDEMGRSDVRCLASPAQGRLHRTWTKGVVSIPNSITKNGEFCRGTMDQERVKNCLAAVRPDVKTPAFIFMHGCDGMNMSYVAHLGSLGYPVFAPDSLARGDRKIECEINNQDKPRSIIRARLEEAKYAFQQIRALPWVDDSRIILAGFSEGGITTALYEEAGVTGKMIFGWSCNAFDPWWRGVRGASSIPVLAIVGSDDPYHQNPSNRGDCGEFIRKRKRSSSIVIPKVGHDIIRERQAQNAISDFVSSLLTP